MLTCQICGKEVGTPKRLELHMKTHNKQTQPNNISNNNTQTYTYPTIQNNTNLEIDRKRTELELLRMEAEIKRLSKPDIQENNYFEKMLQMQQQHFNQMLEMQNKQNSISLELEKMKLGLGDNENDSMGYLLEMLEPHIPTIIAGMQKPKTNNITPKDVNNMQNNEIKPEINKNKGIMTLDIEEVKRKVKAGEVTFEEIYEDLKTNPKVPLMYKSISKEQAQVIFDNIKNS